MVNVNFFPLVLDFLKKIVYGMAPFVRMTMSLPNAKQVVFTPLLCDSECILCGAFGNYQTHPLLDLPAYRTS